MKRKPIYVLILPRFEDISNSYYTSEIIKGVNFAASRLNVDFLVHITDRANHSIWLDPTLLDRKHVDGILFADIDNDVTIVKKAIMAGMPCLVLNNKIDEPINCLWVNNYEAAFKVVEEFIKLGHKNIATIAGDLSTQAGQARLEGYYAALKKHDIEINKEYVKIGGFLRTPARQAAQDLLKQKERPTAIFAASDVMALELMDVVKGKKIAIGDDLSICGFDDNPLRQHAPVPLATVGQPLMEMGRLGLEYMHQIANGKAKLPVKEALNAKLIKAQSMGKI